MSNTKHVKKVDFYVANQLKEDMMTDQITIKEYRDHFKGKRRKCKWRNLSANMKVL